MYFKEKTIDDLLRHVYSVLLQQPFEIKPTRDTCSEVIGAMLCLENPLDRISRTESRGLPFSALGEFLWYMKKDDSLEFIKYFIPKYEKESEEGIIFGAYGPRLFKMRGIDQIGSVINLLRERPTSRRAIIQLFNAEDITDNSRKEIPCTCTLQFFIRYGKLDMVTHMRSNDAYKGLPHDIFAFTMLQELLARTLSVELGQYIHMVGSLHLYESDIQEAREYLKLGYQSTTLCMPRMPDGDNWQFISTLIEIEEKIREDVPVNVEDECLNSYWADLARLLQILYVSRKKDMATMLTIQKTMDSKTYNTYIEKRLANL